MANLIGKKMFPIDNSFSYTIGCGSSPYLAGTYRTKAKKVLIVSEPYKLTVSSGVREHTYLFVTVFYKGKNHVVINNFSSEQPFKKEYDG